MSSIAAGDSQDSENCDCLPTSKPGQSSKTKADSSESEKLCDTEGLKILEEFKKLYENRIDDVDQNIAISEFERNSAKVKIMTEWVEDLKEQNIMLVRTVEDLEKAAVNRVKLLEDKLLQSANLVSENIAQYANSGEALYTLSDRISELERDEYLQNKIEYLQSDIRGLFELIRRAHVNSCWNHDGITFYEIKPEDIPVPFDCTCNEEMRSDKNEEYNNTLKTLQDNETKLLEKVSMLEQQVSKQNKIILQKEEAYKKFQSKVQTLRDNLKEKSVKTISDTTKDLDFDIVQVADFLESAFVAKDLEIKNLHERLEESNAKLEKLLHENEMFEAKNKQVQELEIQLADLQKESLESKEALASEVAEKYDQVIALRREIQELEDKCHHLSMQTQFKEDIIKDLRKELKQVSQKDVPHSRHVRIQKEPSSEIVAEDSSSREIFQNEIMMYLSNTKQLMEKEKEALFTLKEEIKKVTTELRYKQQFKEDFPYVYEKLQEMESLLKSYRSQVIENNDSVEKMKSCFTDIEEKFSSLVQILLYSYEGSDAKSHPAMEEILNRLCRITNNISGICSEKEITLECFPSKEGSKAGENSCNDPSHEMAIKTFLQQFKRMEEFRICAVEAQAATEDLREEMENVVCNFTCRHEKYCELNKLTAEVQNYLITAREKISKTISQVKLQGDERRRYNERISSGGDKLKDMKNDINLAQMQFSQYVNNMQENNQELGNTDSTENYSSNDVLNIVADEVEQILSNLQAVREKEYCTVSLLSELNVQLSTLDNNIEKLYNKSQEILKTNEVKQKIYEEKEKCIEKLEKELDFAHTNMQDALETISTAINEINELDAVKENHFASQDVNEILKSKDEYYKLRREHESLRMKLVEDSYKKELDESVNECKCQITNLLGQIRFLQSELKIGHDANCILESHIQVLEKELIGENKKSEDTRRSFSKECMQFKRKISELQSTLWRQKEIESNLRRTLASSEIELKNSKEMLNSFQTNSEGTLSTYVSGASPENCFAEVEKMKHALFTKEKMLKDREEIIKIQKDSIAMTQNELKDLHEKLQEKIDGQNNVIAHLDKENKQLQNKIELQIQTIGHLQNAVVQTKRCLDQMGQKFVSDKEKKKEAIRTLNIFLNETQRQYSECFAEAAKQDSLLELQRDSIESLQQKIICKESNELCKIILLHCIYSTIVFHLQEQLKICGNDCETLKLKIESLKKNNKSLEEKYLSATLLWKDTDFELNQMKNPNKFETKSTECNIGDEELEIFQLEYKSVLEKNEDLKKELQKYRIDFEIIEQELKKQNQICSLTENLQSELDEAHKLKLKLERENEDLEIELEKYRMELEIIQEELKTQSTEYIPKLKTDLENLNFQKQVLILELEEAKNQNEKFIEKLKLNDENEAGLNERIAELENNQKEMIEDLKAKILSNEQEAENYISELSSSEKMQNFLKILLEEKSDCMAKLQAAYQVMKNNNTILKMEYEKLEVRAKEEICDLQNKKKEIQLQLGIAETNYETVTQDFNKSQELLSISVKREVELQQMLTNLEKKFFSRVINLEEEMKLKEILKKIKEELEYAKEEVSSKKMELEKIQSACNLFSNQLEETQYELQNQKKNNSKLQSTNCCFKKKLQDSKEETSKLLKRIKYLEQNNDKSNNELEDMHNLLIDLKKECKMKNRSLASITAELSQATASRSELRNESQYVVSCIRDWMEEQNSIVDSFNEKLKNKQEKLEILVLQKKGLLSKIKEQKRIINAFQQKRKRHQRSHMGIRNSCNKNYSHLEILQTQSEPSSSYSLLPKKYLARRCKKSEYWSSSFFQKIEHLTKALKQGNEYFNENSTFQSENDLGFDENRDCGYQSSTSK